jgi:hypothetical protein
MGNNNRTTTVFKIATPRLPPQRRHLSLAQGPARGGYFPQRHRRQNAQENEMPDRTFILHYALGHDPDPV